MNEQNDSHVLAAFAHENMKRYSKRTRVMIADKKELRTVLKTIRSGGGMTSDEYRVAIKAVGLKQERAGIYFGRSPRVGQAWALGEYDIPLPVQWCLQFMVANGISAEDIE